MNSDQGLPNHYEEDESDTTSLASDIACPLGQQLIGALFGFLLAYIGLLSYGPLLLPLSGLLATGTSFGTLAAAVSNPFDIIFKEFLAIFLIAEILCLGFFSVIGLGSLPSLLLASIVVSGASSTARSTLQLFGYFKMNSRNILRTSEKLRV